MISLAHKAVSKRLRSGFTLVEILVATGIGSLVMAGVLTSFIHLGKSQVNLYHYTGMEAEARQGLERFGQDVRGASYLTTTSPVRWPNEVKLTIPKVSGNGVDTVYYYYNVSAKTLSRIGPDPHTGAPNTTTILIRNLENCEFMRWQIGTSGPASNDMGTDQLQIRLTIKKQSVTAVAASNLVVSARYVLRNHKANTALP